MVTRRGVGFILPCAAAHFVWMLNAIELNRLSAEFADDAFPVTWSYPATGNIVSINIHGAWRFNKNRYPVSSRCASHLYPSTDECADELSNGAWQRQDVSRAAGTSLLMKFEIHARHRAAIKRDLV